MKKIEEALGNIATPDAEERAVIEAIVLALAIISDRHDGYGIRAGTEIDGHQYVLTFTRSEK